ncbi:hypothetical protein GQF56_21720 [Rhodobacter sphaeroides]|mgnify:CR=1 FL=1|uniref:Type II toxin-antitoxin system PemK/MazF family toxin n=1 Tax=Cereibacter sphaeroides (strain ATCC 17023 / DSM 158 / JCM 6121 / CCUG 31486 / LMG 2827 / NBRC 12203 / NCIMB 8253 / ATH 2.4.1.) TaxID=272943 RepID=Q3IV61_CERS4|nr:type II toxin-antitoxin system PemK/MazF family toxin [Cereibacter sphaeroides]ABA81573.1 hypothetical protein RSP_4104 [Cereibacter sphaeroides 2.4.1]AMJ50118.1 hypothetical protein APX01_21435 [Cereibacter sphaeroides]ANS36740.1 hypothetical protein A3858_20985 [Cereibacter sphaeroides]ATN65921.1 hypothetical protein A3857_21630 [Cereibacter sphaeroides]AXC64000.1 hypothetical protein DQL45_21665 [Cereibacter sphaeroides 2.4.1]
MLDAFPLPSSGPVALPAPASDWRQTLAVGDVVAFRFPVADVEGGLPKTRPCLVLEVDTVFGERRVTLAYGTTVPGGRNRGYEVRVSDPLALAAAGLHRPTRFVAQRRITVSPDNPGFAVCRNLKTPRIGRLAKSEMDRLQAVRARLHAEADIAADRRAERRRELADRRPQGARPARPFTVEIVRRRKPATR